MPPFKSKTQKKEIRSDEEISIDFAKNSSYTLMIPMKDAQYVRVRNPITGKDPHFSTSDTLFFDLLIELSNKGLQSKIEEEFSFFAQKYNSAWSDIKNNFNIYKESLNESS